MNDPFKMEHEALRMGNKVSELTNRHEKILATIRRYTEQNNVNAKTFDKMREINGKNITRIDMKITVEDGSSYEIAIGRGKYVDIIANYTSKHVERSLKQSMRLLEKAIAKYTRILSKHT